MSKLLRYELHISFQTRNPHYGHQSCNSYEHKNR